MKVWSVRAYFATASPITMSATTASAGSCRRCRGRGAVTVISAASTAPVIAPPRCACQAMPGMTKPRTALMARTATMPAEDRPRCRFSTSRAANRPNTAPEAPTVPMTHALPWRRSWTLPGGVASSR